MIPRLVAGIILIFSIVWIRFYVNKYAEGKYSSREVLIIVHTTLFFFSVACQIVYFELGLAGNELPANSVELYRIVKCFYIMGGIVKLLNAAIMLLFFYMAF